MPFLDPTNDVAFRKVFGDERRTEALIGFINAVLRLEGERRVVTVEVINPYLMPMLKVVKTSIVDVRARTADGEQFIVEMQLEGGAWWVQRALFNLCKGYSNQLPPGSDNYHELKHVYLIGVLDFMIDWRFGQERQLSQLEREERRRAGRWFSHKAICDVGSGQNAAPDLNMYFLELPAFHLSVNELKTPLERWAWFFRHAAKLESVPPELAEDAGLQVAFEQLKAFAWSNREMDDYTGIAQRRFNDRDARESAIADAEAMASAKAEERMRAALEVERAALEAERAARQAAEERAGRAEAESRVALGAAVEFLRGQGMSLAEIAAKLNLSEEQCGWFVSEEDAGCLG